MALRKLAWTVAVVAAVAVHAQGEPSSCEVLPAYDCGICFGDCNADDSVSMAELVRTVRDMLTGDGEMPCVAADANGDGRVAISELVRAVGSSLDGCPPYPIVREPGAVGFGLSWLVYADATDLVDPWSWPDDPVNEFSLRRQHVFAGGPPLRRGLHPGSIVFIGVDATGGEIARTWELDPRFVVFDCRDPESQPICGRIYSYPRVALTAYLPYAPEIVELRIYEATGWPDIELVLLGKVPVNID